MTLQLQPARRFSRTQFVSASQRYRGVHRYCRRNNNHGSGIVLGTFIGMLLVALLVGGAICLVSIGSVCYYQARFNNVANAGARYAVDCNYWLGAERPVVNTGATDTKTKAVITSMLQQMGVSSSQATITVDQSNANGCAVSITITGLPIIKGIIDNGGMTIIAQGFESWLVDAPVGVEQLGFTQGKGGFYLPSYGAGSHTPGPSSGPEGWNLVPYWENGAFNGMIPRVYGPYQNTYGKPCANCY